MLPVAFSNLNVSVFNYTHKKVLMMGRYFLPNDFICGTKLDANSVLYSESIYPSQKNTYKSVDILCPTNRSLRTYFYHTVRLNSDEIK